MKESTAAGYLTAERKSFHDITDRLMNVNLEVLLDLTKRMTEGESVKPETEEAKLCFKLTWESGPLLRMACTSPKKFHWFLCKMTQRN